MFLQFSRRSYENESFNEDYVCYSILQLKLFSLLYNLVFVASMVSTQPRTKNKSWLARNQGNACPNVATCQSGAKHHNPSPITE
jgi:hypothetical protein